jgi:hypothetical protein
LLSQLAVASLSAGQHFKNDLLIAAAYGTDMAHLNPA